MDTLKYSILKRNSTREFLPRPIPRHLLDEALALAQHAPSNSNIQPWRLYFATGAARDRLATALLNVAQHEDPRIPPLPKQFQQFRSATGNQVWGVGKGIARDDHQARRAAVLHNYDFFGAPTAAVICMHRDLDSPDSLSVGMYLQTLLLALTNLGIDSCVQVSLAGYPEVLRAQLNIPEELDIICGLAIGYADPESNVNRIRVGRQPVESTTVFAED